MDRLILDTGALIAVERGVSDLPDEAELAVAGITAAELLVGVELADEGRRAAREAAVERILEVCDVLPFDLAAARHHARLAAHVRRSGAPRGAHDLIIAATARSTGRTVVTTDERGFRDLPGVDWRAAHGGR